MATTPAATRFATYPGDVTHMVGQVVGPNTLGEVLTAVEATFDPATGKTRVGFAYGMHELTDVLEQALVDALPGARA